MQKIQKLELKLDELTKILIETFAKSIFEMIANEKKLDNNVRCVLKNSLNLLIIFIKKNIEIWERIENESERSNWTNVMDSILKYGLINLSEKLGSDHENGFNILMYIYEIINVNVFFFINDIIFKNKILKFEFEKNTFEKFDHNDKVKLAYEKVELVLKLAIKIENENALDKKSLNQFIYYSFRLLQLSFSVLINKIDEFWSLVERLCYKPLLMWYSNTYDLMAILCRSNAYEKFYPCLVKICHIITESCQTKNEDDYQRFLGKSILDAIIELTRSYDGYILLNEPLYDEFLVDFLNL